MPPSAASLLLSRMGKFRGSWLLWFFVWYSSSSTACNFLLSAAPAVRTGFAPGWSTARLRRSSSCRRTSRICATALCVSVSLSRIFERSASCLANSSGVVWSRGSFFISKVCVWVCPSAVSLTWYVPGTARGPRVLARPEDEAGEARGILVAHVPDEAVQPRVGRDARRAAAAPTRELRRLFARRRGRLLGRHLHLRRAGRGRGAGLAGHAARPLRPRRRARRELADGLARRVDEFERHVRRGLRLEVVVDDDARGRVRADGRRGRERAAAARHAVGVLGLEQRRLAPARALRVGQLVEHGEVVENPEAASLRGDDQILLALVGRRGR